MSYRRLLLISKRLDGLVDTGVVMESADLKMRLDPEEEQNWYGYRGRWEGGGGEREREENIYVYRARDLWRRKHLFLFFIYTSLIESIFRMCPAERD